MERSVNPSIPARVIPYPVLSNQYSVTSGSQAASRPWTVAEHWTLNAGCLLAFAALLFTTALPLRAQPAVDVFQFLDGSTLHGALEAIDPVKGVRWKHPASATAIEFLPRNAHQIRLAQAIPPPAEASAHHTCRFRFVNGDEMTGNLVSLDAQHIELETWFAGRLRAPRAGVQSLAFVAKGLAMLYDGPDGLNGWNAGPTPASWQFRDGVLTAGANAFMGRDLKLPPQSRLEFDVASSGALNLYFNFYTDAIQRFNFASSGYQLNLGLGYVNLMRGQGNFGMQHLGQAQIPVPLPGRRLHVELRADLLAGTLTLLVDGNVVQQWNDPNAGKVAIDPNLPPPVAEALKAAAARGPVLPGTGVSFFTLNSGIQLSGIKVTAWDGRAIEPEALGTNFTGQFVRFANKDQAGGQVEAIRDGKLTLASVSGGRLEVPLARVTQIVFAADQPPATNRPAGELHARLSSGEIIALTQPRWEGRQLAGTSPHFGPLQFDTRWVRALRFNPGRVPDAPDLPFLGTADQQFFER